MTHRSTTRLLLPVLALLPLLAVAWALQAEDSAPLQASVGLAAVPEASSQSIAKPQPARRTALVQDPAALEARIESETKVERLALLMRGRSVDPPATPEELATTERLLELAARRRSKR